jgi:phospholipid-transporting ATPase
MYDEETDTPALARTSALSDMLGMVKYLLSDKTGTLTQNKMEFAGCSIRGQMFGFDPTSSMTSIASYKVAGILNRKFFPHAHEMPSFHDERLLEHLTQAQDKDMQMFFKVLALCHTAIPYGHALEQNGAEAFNSQVRFSLV